MKEIVIKVKDDIYEKARNEYYGENEVSASMVNEIFSAVFHGIPSVNHLYEFVNGIEPEVVYICDPDKSPCKGSELCYKPGGCFYTTYKDRALDPSTPLYMAESLIKVKENQNEH